MKKQPVNLNISLIEQRAQVPATITAMQHNKMKTIKKNCDHFEKKKFFYNKIQGTTINETKKKLWVFKTAYCNSNNVTTMRLNIPYNNSYSI